LPARVGVRESEVGIGERGARFANARFHHQIVDPSFVAIMHGCVDLAGVTGCVHAARTLESVRRGSAACECEHAGHDCQWSSKHPGSPRSGEQVVGTFLPHNPAALNRTHRISGRQHPPDLLQTAKVGAKGNMKAPFARQKGRLADMPTRRNRAKATRMLP
jgi:hypothetical protein